MTSRSEMPSECGSARIINPNISIHDLTEIMTGAGLLLDAYGIGEAKDVEDLHGEITEGESLLRLCTNGRLLREVNVVWVDVRCILSDGIAMLLKEDRQVFRDGRLRRRNLPSSLGEKIKAGEDTQAAAVRAIHEEIGVDEIEELRRIRVDLQQFIPPTYPGLVTKYISTYYSAVIPEAAYRPEGYVEHQPKKDNYYVWHLADEN